jgi:hypothetical protein
VLAYLSRFTHRVAISNSRLISADAGGVSFKYKDYRLEGPDRYKTMTLEPGEFIRRCPRASTASGTTACSPMAVTRAPSLSARQLIAAAPQIATSPSHYMITEPARTRRSPRSTIIPALTAAAAW